MEPLLLGILLIVAFLVAFSIGSNDEAMAPAVGARIFSIKTAVFLGGILSIIGAVLMEEMYLKRWVLI